MNLNDEISLNIKWILLHSFLFFFVGVTAQLIGIVALESIGLRSLNLYSHFFTVAASFLFLTWISLFQYAGVKHLAAIYLVQISIDLFGVLIGEKLLSEFAVFCVVQLAIFTAARAVAAIFYRLGVIKELAQAFNMLGLGEAHRNGEFLTNFIIDQGTNAFIKEAKVMGFEPKTAALWCIKSCLIKLREEHDKLPKEITDRINPEVVQLLTNGLAAAGLTLDE